MILRARRVEQLRENLAAADIAIPGEVIELLEKLYPGPSGIPTG